MQKKKKFKALVVDFDNTLVGRDFKISQRLERAIKRIRREGVALSIATGRPYFGIMRDICGKLELKAPQIAYGGAQIFNPVSDSVLWAEYIPEQEIKELIWFFTERKLFFEIQKGNTVYYSGKEEYDPFDPHLKFKKLRSQELYNIPKIVVPTKHIDMSERETDKLLDILVERYKYSHIIKYKTPGSYGLDITSGKASKHLAILELTKLLAIKPEDVVGVGDSYNDYPLLIASGVKVAMGDAPRELKEIADFVAPRQNEDGLVEVIERFF